MTKKVEKISLALSLCLAILLCACSIPGGSAGQGPEVASQQVQVGAVQEDHAYIDAPSVAAYLRAYDHLPNNYLTKRQARDKGWVPEKGNLRDLGPMAIIGGDRFGNREKQLPDREGLRYKECDVNYNGGPRGPERLVYDNEGNIYYTQDHYRHFEDVTKEGPA